MNRWFGEYLDAFAACGRGENEPASLLTYYGVPLLLTTDNGYLALASDDQVMTMARRQVEGMLADHYHHSDVLGLEVVRLNAVCALCRGRFSRRRADGSEINRLAATYLVTAGPDGNRISALAVHSP